MLGTDNPIKIIVISPDLLLMEFLETILDSNKYILEAINPAKESITSIRKTSPDLFIVDDLDSGASILSTCQMIRQYSGMPIMVLSSQRKGGLVEQTLDAGADEFLIKPIPGSVLTAHLNTLARRALAEKEAALSIVSDDNDKRNQLGLLAY
jgi:DNA-binding response OmpR family regulator